MNDNTELSPWEILGVAPDADERTIKRAYARLLKAARPEEKPEEFQQLRSAYEYVLAMASQAGEYENMALGAAAPAHAATMTAAEQPAVVNYGERHTLRPQAQQIEYAPQPHPGEIAYAGWQAFLSECTGWSGAQKEHLAPLGEILERATTRLAALLKQEDFQSLAVREEFKRIARLYCSHDEALPLVRITCLEVLRWEEERLLVNYCTAPQAQLAIDRAIADKQYEFLLDKSRNSEAVRALLMPAPQTIAWRKLFNAEFLDDMRKCLAHIRRSMPEVEHFRLGPDNINRWIDAVDRPWPTLPVLCFMFAGGFGIAALGGTLMKGGSSLFEMPASLSDIAVLLASILLFFLPATLVAAYPRYVYSPLRRMTLRIRSDRRIHMGWWGAHVLVSSLAFGLNLVPAEFGTLFIALLAVLIVFDLYLKAQLNVGYFAFLLIMLAIAGQPLAEALSPFMGENGMLMAIVGNGLFLSLRHNLVHLYGIDWYRPRSRLIFLGAGIALAAVEYLLAPHLPRGAALLGWWWILLAVGAADLFCTQIAAGKGGVAAFIWIVAIVTIFYLPKSIELDSPVAGMLHLQITVAMALIIGLMQNGWEYWRARSASNTRHWYE